jgi:uncharacterized cupredoxin-like copper-binding protein
MTGTARAAICIAATGLAACGAATARPAAHVVSAGESEWKIGLAPRQAPHGQTTFRVVNKGDAPHEFVVMKTPRAAAKLPMRGKVAREAGVVGEVELPRHATAKTLRATLGRGHYVIICNLPGHYRKGMYADFVVR